ncbi:oligoribonuclease [Candidatus Saccharibacteria bacterium]|jgi:oligoribonuclease|nr:oligoribonuclease [Candidatus Saccharibacteria bacterium]HPW48413.1 oligoribonuclease [Candidatus Saccharibacteria bacterium]
MVATDSLSQKLLWLDMEMTGLNPGKDRILEVAAIVTNFEFMELAKYESVVFQPPEIINNMGNWAKENHIASGLIDRVQAAPNEQHVMIEFVHFIKNNFEEPAILAGNSIHQDRQFIKQWWPEVDALLHYRMVDVSSFKVIMQTKYNLVFNKKESHRALDDIKESIAELKFYLKYFDK